MNDYERYLQTSLTNLNTFLLSTESLKPLNVNKDVIISASMDYTKSLLNSLSFKLAGIQPAPNPICLVYNTETKYIKDPGDPSKDKLAMVLDKKICENKVYKLPDIKLDKAKDELHQDFIDYFDNIFFTELYEEALKTDVCDKTDIQSVVDIIYQPNVNLFLLSGSELPNNLKEEWKDIPLYIRPELQDIVIVGYKTSTDVNNSFIIAPYIPCYCDYTDDTNYNIISRFANVFFKIIRIN